MFSGGIHRFFLFITHKNLNSKSFEFEKLDKIALNLKPSYTKTGPLGVDSSPKGPVNIGN